MRLRIIHHNIFVGLTNTNKHFWRRCRGKTVKRELLSIANLVPYFSLDFIFFLSSHVLLSLWDHLVPLLSILSCTLKQKLWPLETLDLILTSGHKLRLLGVQVDYNAVHLRTSLVQLFVLLLQNFEKRVQIIELKRFGGAPNGYPFAPLTPTVGRNDHETILLRSDKRKL
jgi:hypothetical protein